MQLEFFGAAGEVTGSCHILRVAGSQLLLDCGMIQGDHDAPARNRLPFPFDPTTIDAVVLSHAHIDHCGRLPLLVKRGFRGPIYTNKACADLVPILLRDSANLGPARRGARASPLAVRSRGRRNHSASAAAHRLRHAARAAAGGHRAGARCGTHTGLLEHRGVGERGRRAAQTGVLRRSRPVRHPHPQGSFRVRIRGSRAHGEHLRQPPASRP